MMQHSTQNKKYCICTFKKKKQSIEKGLIDKQECLTRSEWYIGLKKKSLKKKTDTFKKNQYTMVFYASKCLQNEISSIIM